MKPSTRYTLIAAGFIVFLIFAPLLILYVSGRTITFDGSDTNATGILDAKSNPSGAKLLIDGKEHSSTPAIARFLNQGEYQFTLTKEGYYDWTKRLPIEASKVTYTQEGVSEVQMFKKSKPKILIPKDVSSFALVGNDIWFVQGNNIVFASLARPEEQTVIPLGFHPLSITKLRNNRHLYLTNNTVLDTVEKTVIKVPRSDSIQEARPTEIGITPNNILLYLDGGTNLYAYEAKSGKNSLIKKSIANFTILDNTGYFVEMLPEDQGTQITSAYWNGFGFKDFQTIIAGGEGALYITNNKELFCQCGLELQRVGQTLEPVANGNIITYLDSQTNELSFLTSGNELSFYNFLTNKAQLLTRGGLTPQTAFLIRSSIGYGFIGSAAGLEAIEIDNRDKPNRYQLLSGKQVWQIAITDNQKTIIALQDGALVSLDIRN